MLLKWHNFVMGKLLVKGEIIKMLNVLVEIAWGQVKDCNALIPNASVLPVFWISFIKVKGKLN